MAEIAFASLEALRTEHKVRLERIRHERARGREHPASIEQTAETPVEAGTERSVDDIADFVARIQATGTLIADATERRSLQAILDFWASELAADETTGNFGFAAVPNLAGFGETWPPPLPADARPPEPPPARAGTGTIANAAASAMETMMRFPRAVQEAAATITGRTYGPLTARLPAGAGTRFERPGPIIRHRRSDQPVAAPPPPLVVDDKTRGEIIRISAIARQWRRNRLDGYLLSGDALSAADELCKRAGANGEEPAIVRDKDIADFLDASKRHAAETTQLKSKYLYVIIALLALALIGTVWKWREASAAQAAAVAAQKRADVAREEADKARTFAQEQAIRAEKERAEAVEARAAAELQAFNARQAQREAAVAQDERRWAYDEVVKAEGALAEADAQRQRALGEAETELRRVGANAAADEFRKAKAATSQSDVLKSVIATLQPNTARDGPVGPGRDTQIAGLADRLSESEPAARAVAAQRLASVLSEPGLRDEAFVYGVDRVASLLAVGQAATPAATPADTSSRDAALAVLSAIPEARWDASPTGRAMARAAVGLFEQSAKAGKAPLPQPAATALQTLKARIDWPVAADYRVDFQFAGYVRAQAQAVSSALKALGWRIDGEERTANAAGINQIRYGDPKDAASAELLAADARRAGASPALRVLRVAEIKPGRLEVWISR
ncbi:hypothetical protein SAMN05428997_12330 [Bosea sp. CRIB-10]|uniref:hypothetical protein n=1 Tax=Bosea sp. CRIB-10 TaxID=378404 RepID=UPI0008E2B352|nr:hypothetical protein [Bosea sp. CRIB-10]SFD27885.1 hypothetical protein SAMN05428997_12330 [Bosea sp. CRIB-10]